MDGELPLFTPDRKRAHARLNCPRHDRLLEGIIEMAKPQQIAFDAPAFLAETGLGRKIIQLKPKQAFFSQGGPLTLSSISERSRKTNCFFRKG